jgi:hypothetical protein
VRLGDESLSNALVERPAHDRAEQLARLDVRESYEPQFGQPGQRVALVPLALSEHEDDRLRLEPPGDEREHVCRRLIKPLRVVDQAQKRLLVGSLGKKTQQSQPNKKAIGPGARAQAERCPERIALGSGQPLETTQQGRTQLVEAGERELHLRFHPDRASDATALGAVGRIVQQRRLSDPRLSAEHDHAALSGMHRLQQPLEGRTLRTTASQHRSATHGQLKNHPRTSIKPPARSTTRDLAGDP